MKKRLLAGILTLTMTMSFLAGCGGEDAGESGKGTEDKSNVSGTSGDGGAGLGDYEKVSGFSVYCANGGIDNEAFNNQPLAKKIREVTGYDV